MGVDGLQKKKKVLGCLDDADWNGNRGRTREATLIKPAAESDAFATKQINRTKSRS